MSTLYKILLTVIQIDAIIRIVKDAQDTRGVGFKDLRFIDSAVLTLKKFIPAQEKQPTLRQPKDGEQPVTQEEVQEYNNAVKAYQIKQNEQNEKEIEISLNQNVYMFVRSKIMNFKHYSPENDESRSRIINMMDKFKVFDDDVENNVVDLKGLESE